MSDAIKSIPPISSGCVTNSGLSTLSLKTSFSKKCFLVSFSRRTGSNWTYLLISALHFLLRWSLSFGGRGYLVKLAIRFWYPILNTSAGKMIGSLPVSKLYCPILNEELSRPLVQLYPFSKAQAKYCTIYCYMNWGLNDKLHSVSGRMQLNTDELHYRSEWLG